MEKNETSLGGYRATGDVPEPTTPPPAGPPFQGLIDARPSSLTADQQLRAHAVQAAASMVSGMNFPGLESAAAFMRGLLTYVENYIRTGRYEQPTGQGAVPPEV